MLVRWGARPAQVSNVFDGAFGLDGWFDRPWTPAVDVAEDTKSYSVAIELPGVKAEDLKIEVDGNRLTVKGEKKGVRTEETDRVHRFERRFGSFERAFTLPETVNTERIEAKVADGVLTLTLPKVEKAQPRAIAVKVA
jgi:HSP20 family protein